MASYNELTHSQSSDVNSMDPLYRWDTHFPERLSKLHLHQQDNPSPVARRQRARRNRNASRFKTQPITFDEIKEVDEETKTADTAAAAASSAVESDSFQGIKSELAAFSRSMDGMLPGNRREKKREPSTDSNKENTPCDPCRGATAKMQDSNGNTILSTKSSEPRGPTLTTAETTTSTGVRVPAGLPTERVGNSNKRKSRKKVNKEIVEEGNEDNKPGGGGRGGGGGGVGGGASAT